MRENKVTINALKTEFILIVSNPKLNEIEKTCCTDVQGETIYRALYTKSLGFYVDQNLDWGGGGGAYWPCYQKLIFVTCYTSNNCKLSPYGSIKKIYRSLIEVTLDMVTLFGVLGEKFYWKNYKKIQNRAARVITRSDYDAEAGPLIDELGSKTVREVIISDTAVMMFKIMNNMAPQYLTGILTTYQVIPGHGNPQKRRTMFIGYLVKYCSLNYQKFHQVFENTS